MVCNKILQQSQAVSGAVASQPDLAALAANIRTWHAAVKQAMGTALQHAIEIGSALAAAKAGIKHGQWLPWLKRECDLSERTAQRYMEIAAAQNELVQIRHAMSDLSLAGASRRIRQNNVKPKPDLERPPKLRSKAPANKDFDAIAWWGSATLEARRHFLDSVGSRAVSEALPPSWEMTLVRDGVDETGHLHARIAELMRERDLATIRLERRAAGRSSEVSQNGGGRRVNGAHQEGDGYEVRQQEK